MISHLNPFISVPRVRPNVIVLQEQAPLRDDHARVAVDREAVDGGPRGRRPDRAASIVDLFASRQVEIGRRAFQD